MAHTTTTAARQDGRRTHGVVVAGGGPTGLVLAAELVLGGADVVVLERLPEGERTGSRAGGLHARTLELLDARGIAERFLDEGQIAQVQGFAGATLSLEGHPTRFPHGLGLWQHHIERLLRAWADELGVRVEHGCEVAGFTQDDDGVDVALSDGRTLRARYLVGCDGGRSTVRKAAGIAFEGWDAATSNLVAEVEMAEEPELGFRRDAAGVHAMGRDAYEIRDGQVVFADHGPVRLTVTEEEVRTDPAPTLDEVREAVVRVWGRDFGLHSPSWTSRFTDATRQAATYRAGRVLLAGDAAHVHSPMGGQGLNLGVQDAMNVGWKLARVVTGDCPDALLDTYDAERRPAGAAVLQLTMALTAVSRTDPRTEALREIVADVVALDEPRSRLAARIAALDVRYDLGDGHPLLGRRMPDLELGTAEGPRRVAELLREAVPVLVDLGPEGALDVAAWGDRVRHVRARHDGPWELPVIGEVDAPAAVLVRPDGHVAWAGDGTAGGPAEALTTWAGPPGT